MLGHTPCTQFTWLNPRHPVGFPTQCQDPGHSTRSNPSAAKCCAPPPRNSLPPLSRCGTNMMPITLAGLSPLFRPLLHSWWDPLSQQPSLLSEAAGLRVPHPPVHPSENLSLAQTPWELLMLPVSPEPGTGCSTLLLGASSPWLFVWFLEQDRCLRSPRQKNNKEKTPTKDNETAPGAPCRAPERLCSLALCYIHYGASGAMRVMGHWRRQCESVGLVRWRRTLRGWPLSISITGHMGTRPSAQTFLPAFLASKHGPKPSTAISCSTNPLRKRVLPEGDSALGDASLQIRWFPCWEKTRQPHCSFRLF